MRALIIPDKFKDSLSAFEVVEAIKKGLLMKGQKLSIASIPIGDGGGGSLRIIERTLNTKVRKVSVSDPLFRPITSSYRYTKDTAYIEMSLASGIELLTEEERNCMNTSSFGTGMLIADAIQQGLKQIYLFIGGSSTNDLGIGMVTALGYRFLDRLGKEVLPIGKNMSKITHIKNTQPELLEGVTVNVVCDVNNTLYGHDGAAYVYGLQKGAQRLDLLHLDNGLRHLSNLIEQQLDKDIGEVPGSGAAGGIGGGALAFLNANKISGISFFLDLLDIESSVRSSDLVITGEGSIDAQTAFGKAIEGIRQLCEKHDKRLVVFCGKNELDENEAKGMEIYDIMSQSKNEEDAMSNASTYLTKMARRLEI
ncbi:MAG: glycerate kinase [Saprospiraceae bacterium]|jgi:glycerate kinase